MAINFNALPNDKPKNIPDPGTYFATIETAEMKKPKKKEGEDQKPDYLNMRFALKTPEGKPGGKIYDILSESDAELVRYKLQRFITAIEFPIEGDFDLKDLVKIAKDKVIIVDIKVEENERWGDKGVVDVFKNEIYYPISEAGEIFGEEVEGELNEISADDAVSPTGPATDVEY